MDKASLKGRREVGALARRLKREGASEVEIGHAIDEAVEHVARWIEWAEEFVPELPDETITARQAEIAAVNRQQRILQALWDAIEEPSLKDFQIFNREFLELSKARRALGGLDAPARVEQKIETTTVESGSIDTEVKALVAKLGLNDGRMGRSGYPPEH